MLLLIKRSVNYTPLTRQTLNSLAREPSSLKDNNNNNNNNNKVEPISPTAKWNLYMLQLE